MVDIEFPPYSVLMSVYAKEKPEWLRESLDSMLSQSIPPSEIVVVKDGRLPSDLGGVLDEYKKSFPDLFNLIFYPENKGLGFALAQGIKACSNEVVARMDSDDYSFPERMERQIAKMIELGADIVGSNVTEFVDRWDRPIMQTDLPISHEEIVACSKRRNPFRHPSVLYLKSKVLAAGNYSADCSYFEDWDLFNRMLAAGCRAANISEPMVAMRVSEDFYSRRGGILPSLLLGIQIGTIQTRVVQHSRFHRIVCTPCHRLPHAKRSTPLRLHTIPSEGR